MCKTKVNSVNSKEIAIRGFSCDTEVKTDRGWKLISDIDCENDRLLMANPETLLIHYAKAKEVSVANYKGAAICLETQQMNLAVVGRSPVYVHRKQCAADKSFEHKVLDDLSEMRKSDVAPLCGFEYTSGGAKEFVLPAATIIRGKKETIIPEKKIEMKAWLEFLGFWLADGCCRSDSYAVYIKQNESNEDYVLSLIRNIGFTPRIEHYKAGGYNNYCVNNRALWEYLRQFGKSSEKYIPEEFLSLAPEYLEALFRGYTNGDSTKNRDCIELSSRSRRLIDNIQEIILKLHGSIVQVRKFVDENHKVLWRLRYVPQRTKKRHTRMGVPREVRYEGKVCDLQVENDERVLLRRNDTITWAAC